MERVTIVGRKVNIKKCLDCSKTLTTDEYNTCKNRCAGCYSKIHDRKYIHIDGSNDVDKILQNKMDGGN